MISGRTALYGIFGHPVEHTFSPGMHNAAFEEIGLDACYVPFSVSPKDLRSGVRAIVPMGIKGVNITVPHKERVIPLLDDITDDARLIGAVNTIEVRKGKLVGHNTDGRGFLRSLRDDVGFSAKGKIVAIAGSGGAARAVGFSLALAGAKMVFFHDVNSRKARDLAAHIIRNIGPRAEALDEKRFLQMASAAHCVINATPMGLRPQDSMPIPDAVLSEGQLVCDLVYNPSNTAFLNAARRRRASTLGGIGMLLYQGVIAFEIWTGEAAPVKIMRRALAKQVAARRK